MERQVRETIRKTTMSERIKDLDDWEVKTLKLIQAEEIAHNHPPGHASRVAIEYLLAEVRALREENERLKKRTTVKFDEVYMGPEA